MPALVPAPCSTVTSAPRPIKRLIESAVAATRVSPESVSAGIAIFMQNSAELEDENPQESERSDDDERRPFHQPQKIAVGAFVLLVVVAFGGAVFDVVPAHCAMPRQKDRRALAETRFPGNGRVRPLSPVPPP